MTVIFRVALFLGFAVSICISGDYSVDRWPFSKNDDFVVAETIGQESYYLIAKWDPDIAYDGKPAPDHARRIDSEIVDSHIYFSGSQLWDGGKKLPTNEEIEAEGILRENAYQAELKRVGFNLGGDHILFQVGTATIKVTETLNGKLVQVDKVHLAWNLRHRVSCPHLLPPPVGSAAIYDLSFASGNRADATGFNIAGIDQVEKARVLSAKANQK
jgi:hypothetical protein